MKLRQLYCMYQTILHQYSSSQFALIHFHQILCLAGANHRHGLTTFRRGELSTLNAKIPPHFLPYYLFVPTPRVFTACYPALMVCLTCYPHFLREKMPPNAFFLPKVAVDDLIRHRTEVRVNNK